MRKGPDKKSKAQPSKAPRSVGAYEAKTRLSALLDAVEKVGAIITITKNGRPVAELRPVRPPRPRDPARAIERMRELRKDVTLGAISIRSLIEAGRRF